MIENFDAGDRLVINGLAGDDVVEASGLNARSPAHRQWRQRERRADRRPRRSTPSTATRATTCCIGNGGIDVLNGGDGDNILIQ